MREFHTICKSDTFVAEEAPTTSFADRPYLQVNNNGANTRLALLHFGLPIHFRHYIVVEATLLFYKQGGTGWTGRTVTAKRITEAWAENAKWNNRPSVATLHAASDSADGVNPVEIDVTEILQDVTAGEPFHGFQISTDGTSGTHKMHSSEGPPGLRPRLRIRYTAKPDAVTNLSPNGVALYDPTPVVKWHTLYKPHHDRQMFSQVQFTTPDVGGEPDWDVADFDSGWQANQVHHWDTGDPPSGPTYAGITDGEQRFWRVRIKDERGNISDWSVPAEVSYESGGTVEITTPANDDDSVQDTTPQIAWTWTPGGGGIVQKAYRMAVAVQRVDGWDQLYDSDWVHSDENDVPIPRGIIRYVDMVPELRGRRYRVKVHVRDGGKDEFGYSRPWISVNTPFDQRTFIFRNGVLVEGTLDADSGGPNGSETQLDAVGMPAGADITYAMDTSPSPKVELVPSLVENDLVHFYRGKNLLTANQSSAESGEAASNPSNLTKSQSNDYAYDGTYSIKTTITGGSTATFDMGVGSSTGAVAYVGRDYVASVFVRVPNGMDPLLPVVGDTIECGLVFFDSGNSQIGSIHYGNPLAASNRFQRVTSDIVAAPSGTTHVGLRVRITGITAGDIHYFDCFQIEENDQRTAWEIGDAVSVGDDASIIYNAIERPTSLTARQQNPVIPVVQLSWYRSSTPDQWGIIVDDELIAHIEGADADNGDGSYGWTWHGMRPNVTHTVSVRARTYGIGWSGSSNEVTVKYVPRGIHLIMADRNLWVPIYGQEEIEETLSRDGNTYYLVGRRDPVRINGPARGMYGTVRGTIIGDGNGTANEHLRDLYRIFGLWSSSPHLRLTFGKQSYHVIVANLTESQRPTLTNPVYDISFDWWQTGGFRVPIKASQ